MSTIASSTNTAQLASLYQNLMSDTSTNASTSTSDTTKQEAIKNARLQMSNSLLNQDTSGDGISGSNSTSDMFTQMSEQFTAQAKKIMALAQTKLSNQTSFTTSLDTISKAITNSNFTAASTALTTLENSMDTTKLSKDMSEKLQTLTKALKEQNGDSAINAYNDIAANSKSFLKNYKSLSTSSTSPTTQAS